MGVIHGTVEADRAIGVGGMRYSEILNNCTDQRSYSAYSCVYIEALYIGEASSGVWRSAAGSDLTAAQFSAF